MFEKLKTIKMENLPLLFVQTKIFLDKFFFKFTLDTKPNNLIE